MPSGEPILSQPISDDEPMVLDTGQIMVAAQHFLGKSRSEVIAILTKVLEGHQRQILGTLTVEELYRDRQAFSKRVKGHTCVDLYRMGFILVSYTVANISDNDGYMEALGATQSAIVKREAEEGRARNLNASRQTVAKAQAEADVIEAQFQANSHVSADEQKMRQNESDLNLEMRKAAIDTEVFTARARAEKAGQIESEEQQKMISTKQAEQEAAHALVMVKVAEHRAMESLKESEGRVLVAKQKAEQDVVEAEGKSRALLAEAKNRAEALKIQSEQEAARVRTIGTADAEKVRQMGEAEADTLKRKLEAEAIGLLRKTEAYANMGEAGITSQLITELPSIAESIVKPLESTQRMVFISNDGKGPSSLINDLCSVMTKIPELSESITGVSVKNNMKRLIDSGKGILSSEDATGGGGGGFDPDL